jgi:hypothetical protein
LYSDSKNSSQDKPKAQNSKRRRIDKKSTTASSAPSDAKNSATIALKKKAAFKAWREKELARKRRSEELYYFRRPILFRSSLTLSAPSFSSTSLSSPPVSSSAAIKKRARELTPVKGSRDGNSPAQTTAVTDKDFVCSETKEGGPSRLKRRRFCENSSDSESLNSSKSKTRMLKTRLCTGWSKSLDTTLFPSIRDKQKSQVSNEGA